MTCAVLLGFSTAGKSTILRRFGEKYSEQELFRIDTDQRVAMDYIDPNDGKAHMYEVFLKRLDGSNRDHALSYIHTRERVTLNWMRNDGRPRLIAAGPFLPMREPEWSDFVRREHPVCFLLDLTPEEVYQGLINRRTRHEEQRINNRVGFGCWDDGVTTTYNGSEWVLLPAAEAMEKINRLLTNATSRYSKYCEGRIFKARDSNAQVILDRQITDVLGLSTSR